MAEVIFRDMVGLKKGLEEVAMNALNDTIQECYVEFMKIIDEDVYKKAKHECGEHFYERTYDIAKSFVINWAKKSGLGISATATIDFDPSKISHDTALKQHANSSKELDGTVFFGILNNDVKQGSRFTQVDREPFFDDFLEWMNKKDNKGETTYEKIYKKNFGRQRIASMRRTALARRG